MRKLIIFRKFGRDKIRNKGVSAATLLKFPRYSRGIGASAEHCTAIPIGGGGGGAWIQIFLFLSLYTARPSFEYYRQVYFVHSGLQDESLQVTISKLP